jgi:hypothetical protein
MSKLPPPRAAPSRESRKVGENVKKETSSPQRIPGSEIVSGIIWCSKSIKDTTISAAQKARETA